jgi:pilus assembly protein CpaF
MTSLNGQRDVVVDRLVDRARMFLSRVEPAPVNREGRAAVVGETARAVVRAFQAERLESGQAPVPEIEERNLAAAVIARLEGTAGLAALLADESLEDVWANGCDNVWVRRRGEVPERAAPVATSDAELVDMIRALVSDAGTDEQERRFDRGHPVVDKRLPGGARLHAVMELCERPSVSIRKHLLLRVGFLELQAMGMFSVDVAGFLAALIPARANMIISGSTGGGKTTMLRALASLIPPEERLVTIEDTWELALAGEAHPNTVELQARQPNIEGTGEIPLSALFRESLRMNPSRDIVGEVRGDEGVTMLHAMNQGNDGSLSTIHASSSAAVFSKLMLFGAASPERLDRQAMAQLIADGVDFVIHLDRTADGERVVASVREVVGCDGDMVVSNETFKPGPDRRASANVPPSEAWTDRLAAHGWKSTDIHWGRW